MSATSLCAGFSLLLFLTACGTRPDGTPYGVNSAKHSDGHLRTDSASDNSYNPAAGMPKGAEMNAVTNGARAGQPTR